MNGAASRFCLALTAFTVLAVGCRHPPNYPTLPIEQKYYAQGPWVVTTKLGFACCDSGNHKYDVFYPTNLGANGFKHPILTWGNGTLGTPSQVAYLLTHMASWGFVVIATEDQATGPGQTILDAAKYLVQANSDASSIFYGKLNVNAVGSIGHSQGAGGAINAFLHSGGLIKTVVPIELPSQVWSVQPLDTANLTSGSVFFIDGSADLLISPPTQPPWVQGEQSIQAYYDAVPASVPKLKGTLIGPNHNDIQGQPDCRLASFPCVNGVYGYLGYPTAWMMDRLQGDTYAHGAFVNATGEIFSETKNWEYVASNIQ
jgi:hypothetical protein